MHALHPMMTVISFIQCTCNFSYCILTRGRSQGLMSFFSMELCSKVVLARQRGKFCQIVRLYFPTDFMIHICGFAADQQPWPDLQSVHPLCLCYNYHCICLQKMQSEGQTLASVKSYLDLTRRRTSLLPAVKTQLHFSATSQNLSSISAYRCWD